MTNKPNTKRGAGFGTTRLFIWENQEIEPELEQFRYRSGGTGFIVRHGRRYFFVTAKHVWFLEEDYKRHLYVVESSNGRGFKPISLIAHKNANNGPDQQHVASDFSVFEIGEESNPDLDSDNIPCITSVSDVEIRPRIGTPVVAQGFPFNLPNKQMDYDKGVLTPRRLDVYGRHEGKSTFPALQCMKLESNWVNLGAIVVPLKFPRDLDGMCGGPVLTNQPAQRQRLIGMTIMAGNDLLQFIEIELIAKFIVAFFRPR